MELSELHAPTRGKNLRATGLEMCVRPRAVLDTMEQRMILFPTRKT
jgi:hypothetical protein